MDVSQAIEHTRAWVEVQARRMPGFCGAHLMGGILALPKDAPLPAYKDVDFNIVCEAAFDRAAAVTRTPVPFQVKLQPHVRPYIVDGAREMIDQGFHREAMFWIGGFLMFANAAIQADAPAQERPIYQAKVDRLAEDLGFGVDADVAARAAAMRDLAEAIFGVADALADRLRGPGADGSQAILAAYTYVAMNL